MNREEPYKEINEAEAVFLTMEKCYSKIWQSIRVTPVLWKCNQYPDIHEVWGIAIMGKQAMYFNEAESGWGWSAFTELNTIGSHHWQQDKINHLVLISMRTSSHREDESETRRN